MTGPGSGASPLGVAWILLILGCSEPATSDPNPNDPLPSGTLAQRLEHESVRSVEPFNSVAVKEATAGGSSAVPELVRAVHDARDYRAFLALVALHKLDRGAYHAVPVAVRASVLSDALKRHATFNSWGFPTGVWSEPASMLVELGPAVEPSLRPLLDDERPALHWGSSSATLGRQEGHRVKDYAAALLAAGAGRPYEYHADPSVRDARIRALAGP